MYFGVIRSRPTAYSKVTVQHNHLNRKRIIQNEKYKCKNNIKLVYLTFILCTCKFEQHKQSLLGENYEQNFPNKKHKNLTHMKSITSLYLVKTMNKISLIKSINNLTHMKSINSPYLVKTMNKISLIKSIKI